VKLEVHRALTMSRDFTGHDVERRPSGDTIRCNPPAHRRHRADSAEVAGELGLGWARDTTPSHAKRTTAARRVRA
jgi:hypothetical protein